MLHVATFGADEIDAVVDAINRAGYGLTFGLHTRIDDRVQHIVDRLRAGNIYVNRNQIGAVVGSQPFGGEGLSGTGPKAGGPHYVARLTVGAGSDGARPAGAVVSDALLAAAIADAGHSLGSRPQRGDAGRFAPMELPGPTGESNRLSFAPRGVVLCLGPGTQAVRVQVAAAREAGNAVVAVAAGASGALAVHADDPHVVVLDGQVAHATLATLGGIAAVACSADRDVLRAMRVALAGRAGPILPLITARDAPERYVLERHPLRRYHGGRRQRVASGARRRLTAPRVPRYHRAKSRRGAGGEPWATPLPRRSWGARAARARRCAPARRSRSSPTTCWATTSPATST